MSDKRKGAWIQTFTGLRVPPLDLHAEEVRIVDIAQALGNMCRFVGHTNRFYSVASHSVLVASLVPNRLKLPALLHDAAEAYLVDLPRPIKRQPEFAFLKKIEARLEMAIAEKFGFPAALMHEPEVQHADLVMLATEARDLMSVTPNEGEAWGMAEPLPETIEPLAPTESARLFLDTFHNYGGTI